MRYALPVVFLVLVGVRAAAAQSVTTRIDTESSVIAYTGRSVLHGFTGVSHGVTGSLIIDMANPHDSRIEIVAPVQSFDSGNRNRDSDMLDAVDVNDYPDVRFVSTQVAPAGEGIWNVKGTLTFHGVTRPIEVPVQVAAHEGAFEAQGHFEVSLTEYGVRRPRLMLIPISDVIEVEFTIRAPLPLASAQQFAAPIPRLAER